MVGKWGDLITDPERIAYKVRKNQAEAEALKVFISELEELREKYASWPEMAILTLKIERGAKSILALKQKSLEIQRRKLERIEKAESELSKSSRGKAFEELSSES